MNINNYQWVVRIYYEDTDAGGVVYHAQYLAFYERARTEMLRQLGFSQQSLLEEHKLAFVVRRMSIEYISIAKLDDLLTIDTRITQIKKASIIFQQTARNQNNKLINTAEVVVACVDLNSMKPNKLPDSILLQFN